MIWDDQPQMVEDVGKRIGTANAPFVLREAFAAIDREALIEKVARALAAEKIMDSTFGPFEWSGWYVQWAEVVLVAAGILPERES